MSGKDGGKVRGPRGRTASCLTREHHFAAGEYQFWDKHPHHHAQPHERESWIYDVVFCSVCYPPELRRLIREEEKARKVALREKESENRTDFKSIQDQMERLTTQVETMSGQVVDLQGQVARLEGQVWRLAVLQEGLRQGVGQLQAAAAPEVQEATTPEVLVTPWSPRARLSPEVQEPTTPEEATATTAPEEATARPTAPEAVQDIIESQEAPVIEIAEAVHRATAGKKNTISASLPKQPIGPEEPAEELQMTAEEEPTVTEELQMTNSDSSFWPLAD